MGRTTATPASLVTALGCLLGLVLPIGCTSLAEPPSPPESSLPPDGIEHHGVVHFVAEPLAFRPLDGVPVDRPYYAVNRSGGRITSAAHHRAGGGVDATIHVEYPEAGGVRYIWLNAYGVLDRTEEHLPDGTYTRQLRSGVKTHRGCSSLKLTFFKSGLLAEESCLDPEGRSVIDENGCQSTHYMWSDQGDLVETACFDEYGRPASDGLGLHRTTYRVNDRGLEEERAFFDAAGTPAARVTDGCARWRTEFDTQGQVILGTCLNAGGMPVELVNSGHASISTEYDEKGCPARLTYRGTTGESAIRAGIAEVRYVVDAHCGLLEESYFDRHEKLEQPSSWTPAKRIYERNEEGLVVEKRCWGDRGRERSCAYLEKGHGSVVRITYDDRGRTVEERAFRSDGTETRRSRAYPHINRYEYGPDGREARQWFADEGEQPAKGLGVWAFEKKYDLLGAEVCMRFLDEHDQLMRSPTIRCAEVRSVFDAKHRLDSRECLDTDGSLRSATMLYDEVDWEKAARVVVERDDRGIVIANTFHSTSGRKLRTVKCTDLSTPCYR